MNVPKPVTLGLRKSFGFGDRLGIATPGHVAAARKTDFAPVFVQQSVLELERTQRSHLEVLQTAQRALAEGGFTEHWGADADHHKSIPDLQRAVAAGYTWFTLDASELVINEVDTLSAVDLAAELKRLEGEQVFSDPDWQKSFLKRQIVYSRDRVMNYTPEVLWRAAVKFGRALAAITNWSRELSRICNRPFEIEVALDETASPTTPHEHLFIGLELKRRQLPIVSLAPHFAGELEPGIDFRGNLKKFESTLRDHVFIAKHCGPYKISFHTGADKFSIYPVVGRICGDLLHVKTSGTSYLEALRVMARTAPHLFVEIVDFCRSRFESERKAYRVSTTLKEIASLPLYTGPADEPAYLDQRVGRQLLHVTYGSVLSAGTDRKGRSFKEGMIEQVTRYGDLYQELLEKHFDRHFAALKAG